MEEVRDAGWGCCTSCKYLPMCSWGKIRSDYVWWTYRTNQFSNDVWKLARNPDGCFEWSHIVTNNTPLPRFCHNGWRYEGNMWIFGGRNIFHTFDFTDELHCLEPSKKQWTNPRCSGSVPPQAGSPYPTAVIRNKVWLYANSHSSSGLDKMYELDMCSLIWTQIQTGPTKPESEFGCMLTAASDNQLVLHGGKRQNPTFKDTWVLDLKSHTWKKHNSKHNYWRVGHAGTTGINKNITIIGGLNSGCSRNIKNTCTFQIMLEPKTLQQLAMRAINNYRTVVPLNCLPKKLITRLGFSETKEFTGRLMSTMEDSDQRKDTWKVFLKLTNIDCS